MENTIGVKKINPAMIAISMLLMALLILNGCAKATLRPANGSSNTNTNVAPTPKISIAQPGKTIIVQRGDTLYNLARTHNITPRDLSAWNGLSDPNTIYPGQTLRLYPSSSGTIVSLPPVTTPPAAGSSTASTTTPPTRPSPPPSTTNTNSGITWQWPTEGRITGRFAANDPTKEGIDIAGQNGQAVRATASGVVIYSGAPPTLYYGELIIIKHNDHWLSAYGHNRKRLVNEGQSVRAGEQIAEMGRTGTDRDILHFEIRHDGKPVDPLRYLPAR